MLLLRQEQRHSRKEMKKNKRDDFDSTMEIHQKSFREKKRPQTVF